MLEFLPGAGYEVAHNGSPHMAVAGDDPFVGGEVGGAHGAAGVEFVGADADLGAQAVFAAVGETRRGVDHDAGGIDALREAIDVALGGAEDRVGVMTAKRVDVIDSLVNR